VPLGPLHGLDKDVAEIDRGRFSHWAWSGNIFSASDNGNPNYNGRRYSISAREKCFVPGCGREFRRNQSSQCLDVRGIAVAAKVEFVEKLAYMVIMFSGKDLSRLRRQKGKGSNV
jgi:hypothetical protein